MNEDNLRKKYPEGPGTIPLKVVTGPLPEVLPDLVPKKWPEGELWIACRGCGRHGTLEYVAEVLRS